MGRELKIRRTTGNAVVFDFIERGKKTSLAVDEVTWSFVVASFKGIEADAYYWIKDLTKQENTTKRAIRFEIMRRLSPGNYKMAYQELHQDKLRFD